MKRKELGVSDPQFLSLGEISISGRVPESLPLPLPRQPLGSEEFFFPLEGGCPASASDSLRGMSTAAKNPLPGGLAVEAAAFCANSVGAIA